MQKYLMLTVFVVLMLSGCATVPLETPEASAKAKEFSLPPSGKAGVYIYRSTFVGQALKKDIWLNGECVGESANDVFFYKEVPANKEHTISTESEFSPNELKVTVKNRTNYFVEQFIKIGAFVGGADLRMVDPETAKTTIKKLDMAVSGNCSRQTPPQ